MAKWLASNKIEMINNKQINRYINQKDMKDCYRSPEIREYGIVSTGCIATSLGGGSESMGLSAPDNGNFETIIKEGYDQDW